MVEYAGSHVSVVPLAANDTDSLSGVDVGGPEVTVLRVEAGW